MKKQIANIGNVLGYLLLSLIMVGITSCDDDILVDANAGNGNGLMDMKFSISAPAQDKVISSRVADYAIQDFYLLVFDEQGNFISRKYEDKLNINDGTSDNHYIEAKVPIGKAYIYGFANINSNVYGNLQANLDNIQNREQLMNLPISIQPTAMNLQRAGATWLMAGTCTDKEVEYYTVQKGTSAIKSIKLRRIDSEITFKFQKGGKCSLFKATNWYCVNAPAKSFLVEHKADGEASLYGNWDASNDTVDYFSTLSQIGNNTIHDNTFTFYMPENRKIAKNSIDNYNEREKEVDPHQCDKNGKRNYVNAPDNATYVVVNGSFEGTTDASTTEGLTGNQQVSATVTYVIHLGYVGRSAKDFFSNRNTKYTYNVTINGVNDIVVEVETGKENAPGATGEVIFQSGSNIYQLDAHYETVLLKFSLKDLVSKYGNNTQAETDRKFRCIVSTPYSNMSGVNTTQDKAWVKVARNENASTYLQDYKGATLMTVDDLLEELETAVNSYVDSKETIVPDLFTKQGDDHVVTYTCFVDEYYYDESDLPVSPSALRDNINIWKSFANQPDRKMYLVCNTQNSADQESSIISAAYILLQRSIKTFYSTEPESGKVIAYGIETLNETGKLPWWRPSGYYGTKFAYCTSEYGWDNTKILFTLDSSWGWNTIINSAPNGYTSVDQNKSIVEGTTYLTDGLKSAYQAAYIACMQRNRNEQGTDVIDDGDIKWYLPSIGQCQAFYIGEAALANARLFNYPSTSPIDTKCNEVHYASSTWDGGYEGSGDKEGNAYSFRLLWAEEGASTSTYNQSIKEWGYHNDGAIHYRCVRNLGTVKEPYDDFYDKVGNTISYPKLNDATKDRPKVTNGELGVHSYNSGNNRYYKGGFEIYQGYTSNKDDAPESWDIFYQVVENEVYTKCQDIAVTDGGARWRAPNLRELTLMVLSGDDCKNHDNTFARTKCPYPQRVGWRIHTQNIGMDANYYLNGQIRCVRDVN